jgi:hypothetical protein
VRLLNLFVSIDVPSRTVSLDYRSTYFLPPAVALDLTERCDLDMATVEPVFTARQVLLRMARQDGETLLSPQSHDFAYTNPSPYAVDSITQDIDFAPTAQAQMAIYNGTDFGLVPMACLGVLDDYRSPLGDLTGTNYDLEIRLLVWDGYLDYSAVLPEFSSGQLCLAVGATTAGPGVGATNVFSTDGNIPQATPSPLRSPLPGCHVGSPT